MSTGAVGLRPHYKATEVLTSHTKPLTGLKERPCSCPKDIQMNGCRFLLDTTWRYVALHKEHHQSFIHQCFKSVAVHSRKSSNSTEGCLSKGHPHWLPNAGKCLGYIETKNINHLMMLFSLIVVSSNKISSHWKEREGNYMKTRTTWRLMIFTTWVRPCSRSWSRPRGGRRSSRSRRRRRRDAVLGINTFLSVFIHSLGHKKRICIWIYSTAQTLSRNRR